MSTHPNVIIMVVLTPNNTTRKTLRAIVEHYEKEHIDSEAGYIRIAGDDYNYIIMEDDYHEGYQISAKEGDIVFFDMVTYGYGEVISWEDLSTAKDKMSTWAEDVCSLFDCTSSIKITANYW